MCIKLCTESVNLSSTRVKRNRKLKNVRLFTPLLVILKQYKSSLFLLPQIHLFTSLFQTVSFYFIISNSHNISLFQTLTVATWLSS